jgi:PQQ-dependent dehydrogenase (s-GDH family)
MNMRFLIVASVLLATFASCKKDDKKQTDNNLPANLRLRIVTDKLSLPWEIIWGPDNLIWTTERGGRISRINPATGAVVTLLQVPDVDEEGEGGLLGMALHPSFSSSPYVYIVYNYFDDDAYKEKIVRYTFSNGTLNSPLILMSGIAAAGIHNGSRIIFSSDGKLLVTTGDAANQSLPQNPNSVNGKVLRLNPDGSIPADNPVPGSAVWTTGHRNAQGLVTVDNIVFSSEHGADSDDEINIIEKGRNYGWPNVRGKCDAAELDFCQTQNVAEPIFSWTPTVAVSGLDYYGSDYIPQWKNSLLVATLKGSQLIQLKLNDAKDSVTNTVSYFNTAYGRLRDVCIAPDGKVYICTSNGGADKILEVTKD